MPPEPSFDPANEVGVTEPFGYFDPAGFCKKGDKAGFRNLRAAEIKHGRVAMMAAVPCRLGMESKKGTTLVFSL